MHTGNAIYIQREEWGIRRGDVGKESITMISTKACIFSRLGGVSRSMTRDALMLHKSCQAGVCKCPCPISALRTVEISLFIVKRLGRMKNSSVSESRFRSR